MFFSFFTAPVIFKLLDREKAGEIGGIIFPTYYLLGHVCAALITFSLLVGDQSIFGVKPLLLFIMIAGWLYAGLIVNPKSKNIIHTCEILIDRHNGSIPKSREELEQLPGVGRKTANVVLGTYYQMPAIVVDTHVIRLVNLLGFCKTKNAVKIERELANFINKKYWVKFTHLIIDHGRKICIANRPRCDACVIKKYCPSASK